MSIAKMIAKYISEIDYQSIPEKIIEEMKTLLLDYIGVAIGGMNTESGKIAAQFSKNLEEKEESTIIGFGYRVSAPSAAFSNAILSHSIELDDVDHLAYFHFSPPILSAALAMAEREHISGKKLLVSLTTGCDIMARLSSAMNPSLRDRGFHTTSVCGVFGATAASVKILNLDSNRIISALGLAGAQASGLMEFYGTSMQKRFNPGPAARAGIVAAILAYMGFTGTETIIEGERGFLRAYSDNYDRNRLIDGLGEKFPIFIEYKPYACARPIHNAIDCSLELREKYSIDPLQIVKIKVFRHPRWGNYHNIKKPQTYHEAQVSLPYAVAISFVEGKAFLPQFSEEKLKNPLVQKLTELVEIEISKELPRDVSCKMEIILRNGSRFISQVDYPKGSIENPMSINEKIEKFNNLTSEILNNETRKKIENNIFEIEKLKDVSELLSLAIRKI